MKNLHIGARLGLGFALVLLFLVAMTVAGVWRMHSASVLTDAMVHERVRNERMLAEWARVIEVNAARTTTAYKAADPAFQKEVEAQMKKSSARATELQDRLATLLVDSRSRADLAAVQATRKAYLDAREIGRASCRERVL